MHIPPYVPPKSRPGVMFGATVLPFLGILPQKFQKTGLWCWWHLMPNFMLISEVPEKTVTKQNSKLTIPPYGGITRW